MQAAFESMQGITGVFTSHGPGLARAVLDDVKGMKDMGSIHFNVAAGVLATFISGAVSFNLVALMVAVVVAAQLYGERGGVFAHLSMFDNELYRGVFYCTAGILSGSGAGMMLLGVAGVRLVMQGYKDFSAQQGSPSSPGYSAQVPLTQAGPPGCATA